MADAAAPPPVTDITTPAAAATTTTTTTKASDDIPPALDLKPRQSSIVQHFEISIHESQKSPHGEDDEEMGLKTIVTASSTMTAHDEDVALDSITAGALAAVDVEDYDLDEDDEDDDEDDMDDLDDMLDEFSGPSNAKSAQGGEGGESSKQGAASGKEGEEGYPSLGSLDDDFAKQLQQGMVDLLKGMEDSPELQAQFDSLVQELDKATAPSKEPPVEGGEGSSSSAGKKAATASSAGTSAAGAAGASGSAAGAAGGADFHDRIAETMARMKESGEGIDTELADSNTDDFLAEMLKQMQVAGGEGNNEEDFSKMLMGMMEQLTNKEILYEPMKELDEKFPKWLSENESKHPADEFAKYREQAQIVRDIVTKFEEPGYKDSNERDRQYVVEKMQKMQSVGSPPSELLGEMSGTDGLPPDIENCPVQ